MQPREKNVLDRSIPQLPPKSRDCQVGLPTDPWNLVLQTRRLLCTNVNGFLSEMLFEAGSPTAGCVNLCVELPSIVDCCA